MLIRSLRSSCVVGLNVGLRERHVSGLLLTDDVETAVIPDAGYATAAGPHGGDDSPAVALRVVHLGCVHALLSVEAARHVDLTCNSNKTAS